MTTNHDSISSTDRNADPTSRGLSPECESIMAIRVALNDESLQQNAALHEKNESLTEESRQVVSTNEYCRLEL